MLTNKVTPMAEPMGAEESNRRAAAIRQRVGAALAAAGHAADPEVRTVNGVYVGLYVLPSSGGHVYVGFGKVGSIVAHRGQESAMDDAAVAGMIAAYAASQAGNAVQPGGQI